MKNLLTLLKHLWYPEGVVERTKLMQDLGSVTNLQKVDVRFTCFDAKDPKNKVVDPAGQPTITTDQPDSVGVGNVHMDTNAVPFGSAVFATLTGKAPTVGTAKVTVNGTVSTEFSFTVVLDPSLPGPPDHWEAEVSTPVAK